MEYYQSGDKINTYLSLGVTENDCLCYCECIIQITQRVKLPLLLFHCNKELLDAFQCQFITEIEFHRVMLCKIPFILAIASCTTIKLDE